MKNSLANMDYNATKLYRNRLHGILSTVSKEHNDYPFGSFVTYVPSKCRTAYLYLSDLAEHTENLRYNSKSSITISRPNDSGDIQNSERLTLVGDLGAVIEEDLDDCKMRFHSIFPESKKYSEMHDFKFYELKIKHARWIGGFGKIAWLDAESWSHKAPDWHGNESKIIDHMNDDHGNTIFSALHGQHGIKDKSAKMAFISTDGYYINCKTGSYFIQFSEPCFTMKKFKDMLIKLAKEYREFEL